MPQIDELAEAEAAVHRIQAYIRQTPLLSSEPLSERFGAEIHLKLETDQVSGSFKARGAFNKYLTLTASSSAPASVVSASSGNHANALAHVIAVLGGTGIVYLPTNASAAKVESLARFPIELRSFGDDCIEAENEAQRVAAERGLVYVSPYSDPAIIGGQATIGLELCRQLDSFDDVLVPVGGGGLIAGVAAVLKSHRSGVRILGCQPEASCVMYASVQAGRIVEQPARPTLADGTAGGVDPASITFPIIQRTVDDFVLVSEAAIAAAIRLIIEEHQILIEGAAALPLAAVMTRPEMFAGRRIVLILSGRKISLATLRSVLSDVEASPSARGEA